MASEKEINDLIAALTGTRGALENSENIYKSINQRVRRMNITMWVGIVGLVLDLSLSAAFAFMFNGQSDLNKQVHANQEAIRTSFCSADGLFISLDSPAARSVAPDKAKYDSEFHVIYEAYKNAGCQPPVTEPVRPPA
jgi:hypothetical protein